MEQYIKQLLEDIESAKLYADVQMIRLKRDFKTKTQTSFFITEIEAEEAISLKDLFGLESLIFPPTDRLSLSQTEDIVQAILNLWEIFNLIPDFPNGISLDLQYELLVNVWEDEVPIGSEAPWHFTFCDYMTDTCPFGNQCECKNSEDEENYKLASC